MNFDKLRRTNEPSTDLQRGEGKDSQRMKQQRSTAVFWYNQVDAAAGGGTVAKLGSGGGAQGQRGRKEEEEGSGDEGDKEKGPWSYL